MQLIKFTLWLLRILKFPLIFFTFSPGTSTINPSAVWPENWKVAPKTESTENYAICQYYFHLPVSQNPKLFK